MFRLLKSLKFYLARVKYSDLLNNVVSPDLPTCVWTNLVDPRLAPARRRSVMTVLFLARDQVLVAVNVAERVPSSHIFFDHLAVVWWLIECELFLIFFHISFLSR